MSKITIELDEDTINSLKQAAETAGQSVSEWIANLILAEVGNLWPARVVASAGAWPDFPDLAELRGEPVTGTESYSASPQ